MTKTEKLIKENTPKKYWSKVVFTDDINDCWEWSAGKNSDGYGSFGVNEKDGYKKRMMGAHRFLYDRMFGIHNTNLKVCHHCDNPKCQNPTHYFLGTDKDNQIDRKRKGRNAIKSGVNNGRAKLTNPEVLKIKRRLISGDDLLSISRDFGVSRSSVSKIGTGETWNILGKPVGKRERASGVNHGMATLTEDQVILIKLKLNAGQGQSEIAKSMSISNKLIWNIAHDRIWKNVKVA